MYRVQYWKQSSYPHPWNFQCKDCSAKFTTKFCWTLHQGRHKSSVAASPSKLKRYACHKCGKRFGELANFVFHRTLHEIQKRRKTCSNLKKKSRYIDSNCRQLVVENEFDENQHGENSNSRKTWDLPLGSDSYDSQAYDEMPVEGKEGENNIVLTIDYSDAEDEFNGKGTIVLAYNGEDEALEQTSEGKQLQCFRCHKKFKRTAELKMHTKTCAKMHVCRFCGKILSSTHVLREHELKHRGQCPYECDICGGRFGRQDSLRKHKRLHLGIKKYVCDECGKVFTESGSLGKHKRIHTGSKPFVCKDCGRGFVQSGQLATHVRTHTGEKPFPCPRCDYRFTTQSSLSRHLRAHDGIKRFKCPLCKGMTFLTKEGLENHFIMHNEESLYTCNMCHRTFAREQNLTKHMKLHESKTGKMERVICKICEKTFASGTSLRRHHRRCHQVRPFKCDECSKTFLSSQSLQKHMLLHQVVVPEQS